MRLTSLSKKTHNFLGHNVQRISKKTRGSNLPLVDVFPTIQGEGPYAGVPATFVRFANCNLRCKYCDEDYRIRRTATADSLAQEIRAHKRKLVVFTGGEPLLHPLQALIALLPDKTIQFETNGVLYPEYQGDNIFYVVSPKTAKINNFWHEHSRLREQKRYVFKYVVDPDCVCEHGLPIKVLGMPIVPARPPIGVQVYIQPEAPVFPYRKCRLVAGPSRTRKVAALAIKHGYILSLQTHKYMEME